MSNPYIKYDNILINRDWDYISGNLIQNHTEYNTTRPQHQGIVANFETQFQIWDQLFLHYSNLKNNTSPIGMNDSSLLYVSNMNSGTNEKLKILEYFIEQQRFTKVGFINEMLSSLISTGKDTGIVIDSGFSSLRVLSILKFKYDLRNALSFSFGGEELYDYMQNLNRDLSLKEMKRICKSIDNQEQEVKFWLPDSHQIISQYCKIHLEQEIQNLQMDSISFQENFQQMLHQFNYSSQKSLLDNIMITGGFSNINLVKNYIQDQLTQQYEGNFFQNNKQKNSAFLGAFIYSQNRNNYESFITKQEYQEVGESIIQRKAN